MEFRQFWNGLSIWNKVGLACAAAILVMAIFFMVV